MEQTIYLCIGIGFLACSLVLFFIGFIRLLRAKEERTLATITAHQPVQVEVSSNPTLQALQQALTSDILRLVAVTDAGVQTESQVTFQADLLAQHPELQPGQKLEILYDARHPEKFRLAGHQSKALRPAAASPVTGFWSGSTMLLVFGLLFLFLASR